MTVKGAGPRDPQPPAVRHPHRKPLPSAHSSSGIRYLRLIPSRSRSADGAIGGFPADRR